MPTFWNKLDKELQIIYVNYLEIKKKGKDQVERIHPSIEDTFRLSVMLEFYDNLAEIEGKGFVTTKKINENKVWGRLHLKNLEEIALLDNVKSIKFGEQGKLQLDTSVEYVKASGSGNIWQVDTSNGQFTGTTGEGIILGIIDTGIDFNHPVFFSTDSPKTTRISRIWDQGLTPEDPSQSPEATYLDGNDRYGVVYNDDQINAVLRGNEAASTIKHKDCGGHGTHVASIAAGDGRAAKPSEAESTYKYIGVAPKAEIVVVKILDLFQRPMAPPDPGETEGTAIGYNQQFRDAITYILEVAERDLGNKPVVINYSIGNPHGPHDGLTEQEEFLRSTFGGNSEKRLFVTSAGNDAGDEIYGIATIPDSGSPDSGSVDITFELYDRRTVRTSYDRGQISDNTSYLDIDMWYRDSGAAGSVTVALKLPGRSDFESDLSSGGGPQAGTIGNRNQFEYNFTHKSETATRPATDADPATEVTRHNIHLELPPHNGYFETGNYIVRLSGPADTEIHIWCDISAYKGSPYGIKFDSADPPAALDKKTGADQIHLISGPSGASHILTVAALNDDSSITSYSQGEIVSFSSRGPLMDYSNLGPYTDKPDIAAPGYTIMAARSNFSAPPGKSPCCQESAPPGYTAKSGTSMASPHVAGIAALMLEKNNDLTTSQLIDLIKNNVATSDQPLDQNEYGSGIVDAKSAYDAVP